MRRLSPIKSGMLILDKQKGRGTHTPQSPLPPDWKSVVFSDLFVPVSRKNTERNNNVLTISAQDGLINQLDYYNHQYASADTSGYTLLKKGEFAYNKSYSGDCPYGAIKRLERYDTGVVSPLYLCFSPKPGVDGDFFVHYFNGGMLNRALYRIAQEGARNHGLLNIPTEGFFDAELIVPPLSEQHRITAILSASDRVVENKQKLLEAKQSRKRALLQALFDPKDGIRISKFFGSWRSETLQGIGNFEKGHGITNSQCLSGDCPCVKYGDIYVCYDTHFSKAQSHTTEPVFRQSLRVEAGSLLFTCSGEDPLDIGKCVVYTGTEPIAVGGDILVFHSHEHDPLFLAYQQQTSPLIRQKAALAKGQSIFHIHLPEIQGLQVFVPPTIKEERVIAHTLLAADREIDGLAREIDAWKEIRKALSQLLLSGKVRV